jgi:hypothetical protein
VGDEGIEAGTAGDGKGLMQRGGDVTVAAGARTVGAATGAAKAVQGRIIGSPGDPVRPTLLDAPKSVRPPSRTPGQAVALLAAQHLIADFVASRESDDSRRERMEGVLKRQAEALPEVNTEPASARSRVAAYCESLDSVELVAFITDFYFLDPFAPYSLNTKKSVRFNAIDLIADVVAPGQPLVANVKNAEKSVRAAHAKRSLGKIGYVGIGAAVALGVVGILAAPVAGAALGAAAGLSGAAAVSHGLALLGGGALAAGGAGMAGGMWVVAGTAAAAGLIAGGGGIGLYELGSATARGELVKLQITFKVGILDANKDVAKAQEVILGLQQQRDETRNRLEEERRLNEDNAKRVRELEATVEAIEETIVWMDEQKASSVDND